MSGKVTRLFDRNRDHLWRPAPERQTVAQPALSILDQLDQLDVDGVRRTEVVPGPTQEGAALLAPMPAVGAANNRQRLRHANELLRTFTKTA
jgi:hypothetical protein